MHKRTLDISTCILLITHDRQRRTEKKKSTVLHYPRSTTEMQLYVPAVLEHSPWLSRRRDLCPNSRCHGARDDTKDICVHIYRWCVCALNARQYATLPRLTPTERHVVMYDVWVFPAHRSLCAALPDLTAAVLSQFCDCSSAQRTVSMLSTLLFRMSVSLKNCIIHRRRACLYMLSTTEGARRAMQV